MDPFALSHGLPSGSIPSGRATPPQYISKRPESPFHYPNGAGLEMSRHYDPCSTIENWTSSSSSSPEAMSSYQQHPCSMESVSGHILTPSHSPKGALSEALGRYFPPGDEPSDWPSSFLAPSYTAHVKNERRSSSDWIHKPDMSVPGMFKTETLYTSPQVAGNHHQRPDLTGTAYPPTALSPPESSRLANNNTSSSAPQSIADDDDSRITPDTEEDGNADPPYSHLIFKALWNAPGRKLPLQGIYEWFEKNTSKGRDRTSKGWQNSIRHNLSMNAGFEAIREEPKAGKKAVNYWRLTDEALYNGIQSTTRYRKQANYKKALGSEPPAPQRQRSGAKGGKATKITAKFRGMSQEDLRKERYRQRLASPRQHHHDLYGQYPPAPMTMVVPYHVANSTTPMSRVPASSAEIFDLGNAAAGADAPPCTQFYCDMAGPQPDCLAMDTGFMGWSCIPPFAQSMVATSDCPSDHPLGV